MNVVRGDGDLCRVWVWDVIFSTGGWGAQWKQDRKLPSAGTSALESILSPKGSTYSEMQTWQGAGKARVKQVLTIGLRTTANLANVSCSESL